MRQILLCALLASSLALPAAAQPTWILEGVLIEPRNPTPGDPVRLTVVGRGQCYSFTPVYDEATGSVVVSLGPQDCVSAPGYFPIRHTFEIGPLPAGRHFVEIPAGDNAPAVTWRELFEVREDTAPLDLGDGFQVLVHWSNPRDGSSGSGHARRLARDSGAFWFFSPDNLEVTVKILDGRPVNGHWWVFIASMTDLRFEVEISRAGGPAKTYVQAAGANRNFIDVDAVFEEGPQPGSAPAIAVHPEPPTSADPVQVEAAVLDTGSGIGFTGMEGHRLLFDYDGSDTLPPPRRFSAETTVGPLAPGIYMVDVRKDGVHEFGRTFEVAAAGPSFQLRLRDTAESYFNVYVNIDTPRGGVGRGVTLTSESGYFWFFDPGNVELTVKILDGRAINGSYWVFIASMTDVAFTVEVERCVSRFDPFGCGSQIYRSVQGVNQNFIDVNLGL